MSFKEYFSKQAENPSGIFGRLVMARIFDNGNTSLNNFMKKELLLQGKEHILEIGFGTGKLINELAESMNEGVIEGVDISSTMVSIAKRKNKKNIRNGKVILKEGNFDEVPYNENSFDIVYTVNTIYFWTEPEKTLSKIFKILKPKGMLLIAFEDEVEIKKKSLSKEIFRCYLIDEIMKLLIKAGFAENIKVISKTENNIIYHCAVAVK
ncbi:MAG: class I SAM-dependent methyltransferase [Bacillota bacterium]